MDTRKKSYFAQIMQIFQSNKNDVKVQTDLNEEDEDLQSAGKGESTESILTLNKTRRVRSSHH
jgi:hypothetical protein